jgi:type IV pilus assembly protein PilZ
MTPSMVKAKGITADASLDPSDRRLAPRVLVDLEVDYASEDNYLFAYITDISETGIFVRTTSPEQPGTRLNLRFRPDGASEQIELEGEVIWVNPFRPGAPDNLHPGMGIRFVQLEDEQRDQLLELVRRFAYLS